MRRSDYYRSTGDARQRHRGTYVAIKERGVLNPYFCEEVESGLNLHLVSSSGSFKRVDINNPNLVIERPFVGMGNVWFNNICHARWHEASANQQTKKSLRLELYKPCWIGRPMHAPSVNQSRSYLLVSQFFNNDYPTFTEALGHIRAGSFSVAFSNKFALSLDESGQIVVYYKSFLIGYISNDLPLIFEPYVYLREQLEEYTDVNVSAA